VKLGREIAMEPELNDLGNTLINIQSKKQKALQSKKFDLASEHKKKEDEIIKKIEDVVEGRQKISKKYTKVVGPEIIKEIIVEWTKIPIAASDITDKRLKDLSSSLKKKIIGQDKIIDNVTVAIQRSHLGLSGDTRPLASFMFLGPTGVGKTELAKSLARELFGSDNLLYQINMSEFMEMHSVSKLIGSPPGYVGYQEGGQLTTFVKRKPYSVILFDELEKAHPDVLNLLLQILEEGELTDGKGSKISLKNCIIIMTSNIGADEISSDAKLGFDIDIEDMQKEEVDVAYEDMRSQIMEELKLTLRPEIINRIDLIDIFRGLNKDDCMGISRNIVNEFIIRIMPKGIYLTVEDPVIAYINDEGYSKEYGGRNIRRKVQDVLENGLTQFLIGLKVPKKRNTSMKVNVSMKDNKVVFALEKA
jgi:ATP-dependent Clp protease ATP-binding subunit ClpC